MLKDQVYPMASGLYELSTYCPEEKERYIATADNFLDALSSDYILTGMEPYPFLLDHSVGSLPGESEVDIPIIYADYYYLEALLRKLNNI